MELYKIDYRLYASLLFMGICPAIYATVRIHFLGQIPDPWAYSVAGQLAWVNLIYEIVREAVLMPLFFFMGQAAKDQTLFCNRLKSGLLATACIYTTVSLLLCSLVRPLLNWMAANDGLIEASVTYIRIESIANIFGMLASFSLVALVTLGREKYLYFFTVFQLVFSIGMDMVLISTLPFSFQLGVNGVGYSNLVVNVLLFVLSMEGVQVFSKTKISFSWMREFFKVGGISGLESFVRNIAYMLMIVRMVNVVQEQGIYWVANSFIWGWLLLPVTQLGELIKREIAINPAAIRIRARKYFVLTGIICVLWVCSIPGWGLFMKYVLGYPDAQALFQLVILLLGFYMVYAFQNVIDAIFYGLGKTNYMLFESVVTNSVYYGSAFLLYQVGIWAPTLTGIALLFGFGIVFDGIVSLLVYFRLLKSEQS